MSAPRKPRPMGVFKVTNEYARALPDYASTPKAVFAALALSLAERLAGFTELGQQRSEEPLADALTILREEWATLHANGIVPQRPKARP